ncbi:IgA-specific serine endopeptidase autotransporter [Pseudidiomarina piscicola]|uniref:IgA-specific serine endopeptidase autotransporter n=1 Tax=Pseudidiomarina piscicola TaxID=2614830 RepID=A0A6S6WJV9_9GAMM|nr:cell envelope integrity protein TolA [Pseudidiomarina piscicola]CAB0149469.1 IgA-specific serine endopeptidase autotransporter [Pseudidiomarina piscicola]VZT38914.1 IgA-specific serine endopeptidase autotransporter [Pseudomonas aeruginosa]
MKIGKFTWPSELTVPLLLSVALHLGIVVVLFAGFKWSPSVPESMEVQLNAPLQDEVVPEEEIVKAATVDKAKIQEQIEAIQAEEQRRQNEIDELERRAQEAKRQRETEQQRQRELAAQQQKERERIAREQKAAEQKRQEAEKAAEAAAERRKREEEAAKKAEAERKKREEEARRLEEERKRKEREARERAERERQMQEELAAERKARAAARSRQVQSEVGKYTALIRSTIQRNLITDPSMRGKECKVRIRVASSGFVISVDTIGGDTGVCQATQNAVFKAGTLPVSKDPEIFKEMETIDLTVQPEFN